MQGDVMNYMLKVLYGVVINMMVGEIKEKIIHITNCMKYVCHMPKENMETLIPTYI